MARIGIHPPDAFESGAAAGTCGIWLECKKGTLGLIADDQQGAYLCLYGPGYKNLGPAAGNPLPAFAITLGEDGHPVMQFPTGNSGVKHLRLDKLLKLAAALSDAA